MAVFQIRRLHCIMCDVPRRIRVPIIDGVEQVARCFECESLLFAVSIDLSAYLKREVIGHVIAVTDDGQVWIQLE